MTAGEQRGICCVGWSSPAACPNFSLVYRGVREVFFVVALNLHVHVKKMCMQIRKWN